MSSTAVGTHQISKIMSKNVGLNSLKNLVEKSIQKLKVLTSFIIYFQTTKTRIIREDGAEVQLFSFLITASNIFKQTGANNAVNKINCILKYTNGINIQSLTIG